MLYEPHIIFFVAWVGGYIAMHIYFIVEAFKRMATWSAIVTIIPVIGDILFAVLCVLDGKWWPLVFVLLVIGLKESDKRYTLNMF